MRRKSIGTYATTNTAGEMVRAFVPAPLPPRPALALDGPLLPALEEATLAVGRLDAVTSLLPDAELFRYACVRKEAVLSSQIEGLRSSLPDLLRFELGDTPGVPIDDVAEVSNCVAACDHGLQRLGEGFPISNRLIRELHGILLSHPRGSTLSPGEFRRSQNWIGGSRPGNAAYVPPPWTRVEDCMADLERFLHVRDDGIPHLIRAGLAHVQFETIHPFLDGNGRVGRLLITLLLCNAGVLRQPLLYLSRYFNEHRSTYYGHLDQLRHTGDWEEWLAFYLQGVRVTAESAVATARRLTDAFASERATIKRSGNRRAGSVLRVHAALTKRPILPVPELCRRADLTFPTVAAAIEILSERGMVHELTGKRRNRLFAHDRSLAILAEGTQTA